MKGIIDFCFMGSRSKHYFLTKDNDNLKKSYFVVDFLLLVEFRRFLSAMLFSFG